MLGSRPYTAQWFRNGELIQGADQLSYTLPNAGTAMNGSLFTVKVTNGVSSPLSQAATLTVVADTAAPTVTATPLLSSPSTVALSFSEPLAAGPAGSAANFTVLYHGKRINVVSAVLSQDGKTVTLTLAEAIQQGFVVGIGRAIQDLSGNPVAQGTLAISPAPVTSGKKICLDFGATATGPADDPVDTWNNVGAAVGANNTGTINPLLDQTGAASGTRLEMVRRFNDANGNGTTASILFPASVTRDSLYGNTEAFNGLSNISPAFRVAGLAPSSPCSLVFYASRTGVADNRETRYTVTGAAVSSITLNAANNVDNSATLAGQFPAADGTFLVELSPAPANNNANHFVYLGALVLTPAPTEKPVFHPPAVLDGKLILDWSGTGKLESSLNLAPPWSAVTPVPVPPYMETISPPARFFRLAY